jgi:putrescine transport system ATP-binding protein
MTEPGTAAVPILQIRGLSKSFAGTTVLNNINLDVPRGSILALLGRSGSGKTTLLQLIAGLQVADTGTLMIDGHEMTEVSPHERPVNLMFQSYALFPHLSVTGNIAYGLKACRAARAERERQVAWALELLRLEGLGNRRPDQLSGGQRQRVALARCLVMKPAVLLLDEPLAALDRSLRAEVQRELMAIQRRVGTTFIVVTHDQDEAMVMSDYIAVMEQGRIMQFGKPREVYEHPESRFIASFLGTINLFDGRLQRSLTGGWEFLTNDGLALVTGDGLTTPAAAATLGVRPEKLVLARTSTALANDFAGQLLQVSYCGGLSQVTVRLANGRCLEATLINSDSLGTAVFEPGDTVHVGFPPDAAVLLPA